MGKIKKTTETKERLEQKRLAAQERRRRIKSDPILYKQEKDKDKERYERRKLLKKLLPISEMTEQDREKRRQRNRDNYRAYYKRKKLKKIEKEMQLERPMSSSGLLQAVDEEEESDSNIRDSLQSSALHSTADKKVLPDSNCGYVNKPFYKEVKVEPLDPDSSIRDPLQYLSRLHSTADEKVFQGSGYNIKPFYENAQTCSSTENCEATQTTLRSSRAPISLLHSTADKKVILDINSRYDIKPFYEEVKIEPEDPDTNTGDPLQSSALHSTADKIFCPDNKSGYVIKPFYENAQTCSSTVNSEATLTTGLRSSRAPSTWSRGSTSSEDMSVNVKYESDTSEVAEEPSVCSTPTSCSSASSSVVFTKQSKTSALSELDRFKYKTNKELKLLRKRVEELERERDKYRKQVLKLKLKNAQVLTERRQDK